MSAFEVFSFHDTHNNTIRYLFNPSKRLNNSDEGPALLDQVIETFDPELDAAPSPAIPEPKAGTELFQYRARDGADVRYQFDPTAVNGKQYVVAIHREPANWGNLREEDLGVEDESELRRSFEERDGKMGLKRRDSVMDLDTE
ncbi:hypothetical protein N0V90_012685 [Kalmusia sp. IMI 367209]|nr:hypothetical protein N0V90_012685 [Kalmusia sp. IMI 367209]